MEQYKNCGLNINDDSMTTSSIIEKNSPETGRQQNIASAAYQPYELQSAHSTKLQPNVEWQLESKE